MLKERRSEDGKPIPGRDLQIAMFDLAPPDRIPPSLRRATINSSVDDLCETIQQAEEAQEARDQEEARSLRNIVPDTGNSLQLVPISIETDASEADP